jgi:hypothetical protein
MIQRGKKSATAIAVKAVVSLQSRPEPPVELTAEQGDVWQAIVDALPADWFSTENHPLLIQYVRHTIEARRVAQLIDQECARGDLDTLAYLELLKAQRNESTALKTLAASMRLAQQARYGARGAEGASRRSKTVKRPWED